MNTKQERMMVLTEEGKKELGGIFGDYVPVKSLVPVKANLDGFDDLQEVFMVDWKRLKHLQKDLVIEYMSRKFDAPEDIIRHRIEGDKGFPIRAEFIIESYDMRFFV